jgi:hypothetical protein
MKLYKLHMIYDLDILLIDYNVYPPAGQEVALMFSPIKYP